MRIKEAIEYIERIANPMCTEAKAKNIRINKKQNKVIVDLTLYFDMNDEIVIQKNVEYKYAETIKPAEFYTKGE